MSLVVEHHKNPRIKLERVRLYAKGKAPFVGLPVWDTTIERMVTAVFTRGLLEAAIDFAERKAATVEYLKDHTLRFDAGRAGCWRLIDLKNTGKMMPWTIKDTMEAWATRQRARPLSKMDRKRKALEREIRILEKRLSRLKWYKDDAPRNPVLELGREQAEQNRWDWVHDGWLATYRNKDMRRLVARLGLKKWQRWGELRAACAELGATLPDKPKIGGDAARLDKVNPCSLVSMCGIGPAWRREDKYRHYGSWEHYVESRTRWLENKRARKAMVQKLEDLRELRDMPEKLAASDVGIPDGVEVETLAAEAAEVMTNGQA